MKEEKLTGVNMSKKIAVFSFLGVCIILAILLLLNIIKPLIGGIIFASTLLVFGLLSRGFRK
jgi:hypothetical protein